ncbi:hypothetical protein E4T42_01617 [Aureobasidium subglaciale]|nr:hypothetical protein E4T42_01617 [Aureobasidium subglaciale]
MPNEYAILETFAKHSYAALVDFFSDTLELKLIRPVNGAYRIGAESCEAILSNEALPVHLQSRVYVMQAVFRRDTSIAKEHFESISRVWGFVVSANLRVDKAAYHEVIDLYVYELGIWLDQEGVYEDKKMPFPHHVYRLPDTIYNPDIERDIVDEVEAGSDWTEDDIDSISDSSSIALKRNEIEK